jgi:hypothetical protein
MGGLHVNLMRMREIRQMLGVTPTCCRSDCNSLGLDKGNLEERPRCPGSAIVIYLTNIYAVYMHIDNIELLVPNSKI